eukprot:scaffold10338_cov61-Cylindrotheca_fusiformis.AAC.2
MMVGSEELICEGRIPFRRSKFDEQSTCGRQGTSKMAANDAIFHSKYYCNHLMIRLHPELREDLYWAFPFPAQVMFAVLKENHPLRIRCKSDGPTY